jgi:hypothetical protein
MAGISKVPRLYQITDKKTYTRVHKMVNCKHKVVDREVSPDGHHYRVCRNCGEVLK